MFKLYQIKESIKHEVVAINEIYNVYELGDYEIHFDSAVLTDSGFVFIEDYVVDRNLFEETV